MESESILKPGNKFGQYEVEALLGRGGMGEVYRVIHTTLGLHYALKLMLPEVMQLPEAIERFRREARAMARLEHPNILQVDEFGETDGLIWLRMELATGFRQPDGALAVSLADLIRFCHPEETSRRHLPERLVIKLVTQLLTGLKYAHGFPGGAVIHRDIKPANLLFCGETLKISDFGLVHLAGEEWLSSQMQKSLTMMAIRHRRLDEAETVRAVDSSSGSGNATPSWSPAMMGTFEYMAPEAKSGATFADTRCDLYAAAKVAYQLISGRREIALHKLQREAPTLDPAWLPWFERALEEDPSERFQTADSMLQALPGREFAPSGVREVQQSLRLKKVAPPHETIREAPEDADGQAKPGPFFRSLGRVIAILLLLIIGLVLWKWARFLPVPQNESVQSPGSAFVAVSEEQQPELREVSDSDKMASAKPEFGPMDEAFDANPVANRLRNAGEDAVTADSNEPVSRVEGDPVVNVARLKVPSTLPPSASSFGSVSHFPAGTESQLPLSFSPATDSDLPATEQASNAEANPLRNAGEDAVTTDSNEPVSRVEGDPAVNVARLNVPSTLPPSASSFGSVSHFPERTETELPLSFSPATDSDLPATEQATNADPRAGDGQAASDFSEARDSDPVFLGKQPSPPDAWKLQLPGGEVVPMAFIPPGSFQRGSSENEFGRHSDEHLHEVTLSHGFWIGETELTQAQWIAVMGRNPSAFRDGESRLPVESVSWFDAMSFCQKVTKLERRRNRLTERWAYTLPTEAQWEYACRARSTTRFNIGNRDGDLQLAGWFADNSGRKTHPVGSKRPNFWGLYDMHGNVWEWCLDWYDVYPLGAVTDPRGPSEGTERIRRGGSWMHPAAICRSAYRNSRRPDGVYDNIGFRLALSRSLQF